MNSHEKNKERGERSGANASQFVIALLVILVSYILSTGPVVRLALDDKIPHQTIDVMYAPLAWVDETSIGRKTLEPFFEWYGVKVWGWNFNFGY